MERNEAIEIVRKNYPHVSESGSQFETALRTLVPELAESEDERIRKEMLDYCHKRMNNEFSPITIHQVERWLPWLEKQGKKNLDSAKTCKDEEDWSEEDELLHNQKE